MIVLFDFDGVIMDTETHYTNFWDKIGETYLSRSNFGMTVKGQSMNLIYGKYFIGEYESLRDEMTDKINRKELEMEYSYITGALSFIKELKDKNVPTAIVTSSDDRKMNLVFKQHPELPNLVDYIVTANQFKESKPNPECYLLAMNKLGVKANDCVVFEDSTYGIEAGKAAGAFVVGLATTNGRNQIEHITDVVIDDFKGMTYAKLNALFSKK